MMHAILVQNSSIGSYRCKCRDTRPQSRRVNLLPSVEDTFSEGNRSGKAKRGLQVVKLKPLIS